MPGIGDRPARLPMALEDRIDLGGLRPAEGAPGDVRREPEDHGGDDVRSGSVVWRLELDSTAINAEIFNNVVEPAAGRVRQAAVVAVEHGIETAERLHVPTSADAGQLAAPVLIDRRGKLHELELMPMHPVDLRFKFGARVVGQQLDAVFAGRRCRP